jgi:hypothetical protein
LLPCALECPHWESQRYTTLNEVAKGEIKIKIIE